MNLFIELPILHHNDTTSTFKNIGVDYDLGLCEIRNVIFYHINAISPYIDEQTGVEYTNIHTNGSEYICSYKMDDVFKKISEISSNNLIS